MQTPQAAAPPTGQVQTYPYDCWYIAAHSSEVGRSLLGREILGQPVLLYRQESGAVAALDNRCIHRGMPLSAGRLDGDQVVCGYHGFRYDPDGACVSVPSQPNVPYGARARSFPVREDPPLVWVWMGDPSKSVEREPAELPWLRGGDWAFSGTTAHIDADYLSLHENSLDLTHFPHVHPDLSPPTLEAMPPPVQLEVSELSVSYSRVFAPAMLPPWQATDTGLDLEQLYVQREIGSFVSPALLLKFFDILPDPEDATSVYRTVYVRGFTPETPSSTHLFSWISRNYALGDSTVTERLRTMDSQLIDEDCAIVEMVQAHADRYGQIRPATLVNADLSASKVHEIVERMISREQGTSTRGRRPIPKR